MDIEPRLYISTKINVLDIETYNNSGVPTPYCICYTINNKYFHVYVTEDIGVVELFFESLIKNCKNSEIIFFAHNLNFDGYILLEHARKVGYKHDWFVRDSNLYWIKIYILNLELTIRCSLKIIPLSVESLGSFLEMKKQIFPHDFSSRENLFYIGDIPEIHFFESSEEYFIFKLEHKIMDFKKISIDYCLRDVKIVYTVLKAIKKIVSEYSNKYFWNSFSFSALSYKIFSKKFDLNKLTKRKNEEEWYTIWLRSYCGGRCEVFGNPDGSTVHYYDVPGMYAQAMSQKYPVNPKGFEYENLDYRKIGFHVVKVSSDLEIPVLPYKSGLKLLFPNGTFSGSFWYEELILFVESGGIILKHYCSFIYEKEEFVFKDFINHFTEVRKKGGFYKVFGKSMINGSYGSFALHEDSSRSLLTFNEEETSFIENNMNVVKKTMKGRCTILEVKQDIKYLKFYEKKTKVLRSLDIASITASKGRIILYNGFRAVVRDGGELYYCDTDSIFAGFTENKLGCKHDFVEWTEVFEDGIFMRPKEYMLKNGPTRIKGINRKSSKLLDYGEIKKKFYANQKLIFFKQLQFRTENSELRQIYINKTINLQNYDKRIWTQDKKKTKSLIIEETNPDYI